MTDWNDGQSDPDSSPAAPEGYQRLAGGIPTAMAAARKTGEWNWEGVWEVRAKRDIEKSIAESTLYGNIVSSDDTVGNRNWGLAGIRLTKSCRYDSSMWSLISSRLSNRG
jgi:hypothetical protein